MNVGRLLNNEYGRIIISIILGLGLATLFRRACSDGKCIEFNGPIISQIDGKIYKYDSGYYRHKKTCAKQNIHYDNHNNIISMHDELKIMMCEILEKIKLMYPLP